jgi:stage V sporulation protein R
MEDSDVKALEDSLEPIWEIAHGFGLDPYPVHFEMVPASIMYEFGSYGLPGRFSHWSHGKVYHRMKTSYDYGLSKIYELVINTNPSYAFLMDANSLLQNKLVIAHVLGHCDFFKHNAYFQATNRQMVETASLNANRIRQYEFEHGLQTVERFLDAVLSIQEHIDPQDARRPRTVKRPGAEERPSRPAGSPFDDLFDLTPSDKLGEPEHKSEERVPAQPEKDLVGFIMEHSRHLEPWQRDVIGIVRQEMLYFVPQMQTKICNEGWACATGDSLLLTEDGFVRFDQLHEKRLQRQVAAGGAGDLRQITAHHREINVPTIRLRTRRGLTIEGALNHRVRLADGTWKHLADVRIGDKVAIESGMDIWPDNEQHIDFVPAATSATLTTVASYAGTSAWTVMRHMKGKATRSAAAIDNALQTTAYQPGWSGKVLTNRSSLRLPSTLNEDVAWLLGYFVGDGNRTKSGIGFTTGDHEIAARLVDLVGRIFGLRSSMRWDATSANGRWRIPVHSRELLRWLTHVGINLQHKAPDKCIPSLILRSPKKVMSAFLRGYFDADGYAGPRGVILSSSSSTLISTVQIILLNYGILSSQRPQKDGCIQLFIHGASARVFRDEIGFGLSRKLDALDHFVNNHRWFKREELSDAVTSIEYGFADVFDITVAEKHTYVANGFLNHNSFWHSRIMRDMELTDEEYTDFATMNAGVIAPSRHSINPYYLGVKMLEDIERRWDNPTEEERLKWGRQGGEGRKKLFEVRAEENDVSLIRNYMTEHLVEDLDLYLYEKQGDQWVIVDKNWENVRDNIVARMANFGNPTILVEDGDYHHNGELYLRHVSDGHELDALYAEKTLEYVYILWGRPVYLETIVEGEATVFSYDGGKHQREAA